MLWTSQSVTLSLDTSGSRIPRKLPNSSLQDLEHGVTLCCWWATRYALCESRTRELAPAQVTLCPLKDWYAASSRCPFVCRFHEVEPQKNLHMMAPPQGHLAAAAEEESYAHPLPCALREDPRPGGACSCGHYRHSRWSAQPHDQVKLQAHILSSVPNFQSPFSPATFSC